MNDEKSFLESSPPSTFEEHWQPPNTSLYPVSSGESMYHKSLSQYPPATSPYKQERGKPWSSLQITCPNDEYSPTGRDNQINELKRTELQSPHTTNQMYPRTNSFRSLSVTADQSVSDNTQYFTSYLSPDSDASRSTAPSTMQQHESFGYPQQKVEAFSPRAQVFQQEPLRSPANYQQPSPMHQQGSFGGAYQMSNGGFGGNSSSGSFASAPKTSIAYPISSGPPPGFGGTGLSRGAPYASSMSSPMPPMMMGMSSVGKPVRNMEPVDGYIYQVQFKRAHKNFILSPSAPRNIIPGDFVKVEADRGEDMGIVMSKQHVRDFQEVIPTAGYRGRGFSSGQGERKYLYRLATPEERASLVEKVRDEEHSLGTIRQKSLERALPMVILDAEYQFDRHKLTFFFEADRRIDFRELVSELFSQYKTRIWMQQVDTSVLHLHDAGTDLALATGFLPHRDEAEYMRQAQRLMRGGGGGGGGDYQHSQQLGQQGQYTSQQYQREPSPRPSAGGGGQQAMFSDHSGRGSGAGYLPHTDRYGGGGSLSFDGLMPSSTVYGTAQDRDDNLHTPFSFGMSSGSSGANTIVGGPLRGQSRDMDADLDLMAHTHHQQQHQLSQHQGRPSESMGSMLEEPWAFGRAQ
eukprot:gene23154-29347_t